MEISKFNEFNKIDESSNNGITITLNLDIHPSFVSTVESALEHYGIDKTAEEVLYDYFIHKSGYERDYTYHDVFQTWLEDRMMDDYEATNL